METIGMLAGLSAAMLSGVLVTVLFIDHRLSKIQDLLERIARGLEEGKRSNQTQPATRPTEVVL